MDKKKDWKRSEVASMEAAFAELEKAGVEKAEINLHHDILWIDDRAKSPETALEWMREYCKNEIICAQIDQVDSFFDAMDRIVQHSTQYDLVIFDINLENCFDGITIDQTKSGQIEEIFREYHIGLKEGGAWQASVN